MQRRRHRSGPDARTAIGKQRFERRPPVQDHAPVIHVAHRKRIASPGFCAIGGPFELAGRLALIARFLPQTDKRCKSYNFV